MCRWFTHVSICICATSMYPFFSLLIYVFQTFSEYATCSLIRKYSLYTEHCRKIHGMHVVEVYPLFRKATKKVYLSLLGLTILIFTKLSRSICYIYCKIYSVYGIVYDDHCRGCCLCLYLSEFQVSVFCE